MVSDLYVLNIIVFLFIAFVGLCLGSFATALIYRIPRGIPWIYDTGDSKNKACRSQCPQCGAKLGLADLVPLFSWLFSKGKCRHCGGKISAFYPIVELTTMILVLILYGSWGYTASAFPLFLAVPIFVASTVIDWEMMILPDSLNLCLAILSAVYVALIWKESGWDTMVVFDHVLAGVVLVAVFAMVSFSLAKLKGRDTLGLGDLKFLGPAGFFLGMAAIPSFMALGGILGLITAFLKRRSGSDGAFPFGPALIFSLYIHVFLTGLGFDYKW